MYEFTMPSLGADMDDGTLLEWRVETGDRVSKGDIVALVDTEKSAIEVEIFCDGVIERLVAEPGQKLPIGAVLALVRADGDASAPAPDETVVGEPPREASASSTTRRRISPAARKRARELEVELDDVVGTGGDGTVTLRDVESHPRGPTPRTADDDRLRLRRAIAAAMTRSNSDIPHYYLATTCNMERVLVMLSKQNEHVPVAESILLPAVIVRATALALRDVPQLNGFWKNGMLVQSESVHVGMAIALRGGGVVVPAIHDADRHSLTDVMATLRDLVVRARGGGLRSSELSDGTATVTSLGERAPEAVYGVIFPPQVALVGFGSIVQRPWVVDGSVAVQRVMTTTLAGDHRATDGHLGGRFLSKLENYFLEPERLL